MVERRIMRVWYWLWAVTTLCFFLPMRYTLLKLGFLIGFVILLVLTWILFRKRRRGRVVCSAISAVIAIVLTFLVLPGRPYDSSALRRAYVRCMLSYKGTYYVWGGGSRLGIDCSGLVQRGLIDADLEQAAITLNPRLARAGISLWWHNRSARAIGDEYRGDTVLLREVPSLAGLAVNSVQPGDLAVLADGLHVMAYIGDQTWIEADPERMHVILARVPRPRDYYFNSPARLMRWRQL